MRRMYEERREKEKGRGKKKEEEFGVRMWS